MKRMLISLSFVCLAVLGITSSIQALPSTGFDDVFYSDDTFETPVGEHYSQCNGGYYRWGVRTAYVRQETFDCQTFSSTGCALYTCSSCPDWAWNVSQCDGCTTFADC